MGTVLQLRFPWGRYYATPWGRHVNEGAVEWPPSPWRIVRSLFAVWRTRVPSLPEDDVLRALEVLSAPPTYWLPPGRVAHTRHYLPDADDQRRAGKHSTDLALDAFMAMAPGAAVYAGWDEDLDPEARAILGQLTDELPYLGRAESMVEAQLAEEPPEGLERWEPAEDGLLALDVDLVRLLAPSRPLDLATLTVRTGDLHRQRRLQPPGTEWAVYQPVGPRLEVRPRHRAEPRSVTWPSAVAFRVVGRVPPPLRAAVPLGALLRRAALSSHGDPSSTLSGHDPTGAVRRDGHRHLHALALGDHRIERLLLWAPERFNDSEVRAITRLRRLRVPDHLHKLLGQHVELALEFVGPVTALEGEYTQGSTAWRTATPFAPARHMKPRDAPQEWWPEQVRRELANRGLPHGVDDVEVTILTDRWQHVLRERSGTIGGPPARHVSLRFARPVAGPLALGRLSHYGLGLFRRAVG